MKLTLVSTTDKQTFEVAWLEVNSSVGNFVMQRGHAPMILLLASQQPIIYCLQNGKEESMLIEGGGILHITRQEATIILTS
jgi:F0F1-type ATP synthase epsilon subunit